MDLMCALHKNDKAGHGPMNRLGADHGEDA